MLNKNIFACGNLINTIVLGHQFYIVFSRLNYYLTERPASISAVVLDATTVTYLVEYISYMN